MRATLKMPLPAFNLYRNFKEIASFPSVTRNDNRFCVIFRTIFPFSKSGFKHLGLKPRKHGIKGYPRAEARGKLAWISANGPLEGFSQ